ncbi:MAG: trigger factor [Candidatus Hydrogenedentes bacterium]|nr:trigger factor [Candidatus Hydrogenedentota bacterium]
MAENESPESGVVEEKPKKKGKRAAAAAQEHDHGHDHEHGHDHDHAHHHHDEDEEEFKFVEEPVFDVDYKGECAYEVKVTIPAANKKKQADEMYDELKHDAEVPGFRRGRAPRQILERRFAKVVRSEVDGKLVGASFRKLIKDKELKPIALPDIDGLDDKAERKDEDPIVFTLKFEVAPRVELGKYRGVKVERPIVTVSDKDIDEAVEEFRSRYATFETLADGVAASGDQVIIDFKGTVDGEQFPGGSATNYPYILGTQRFFSEFEDVLLGCSAGDELSTEVKLPEDSPNAELRDKTALFTISVKEVKRRSLPALDAEFAKKAGAESVDALRERLAKQLQDNSRETSERIARGRALDAVIEKSTYEIPKSLIASVAQNYVEEEVRRLIRMRVPVDQIEQRMEEVKKQADESAIDEIKRTVTLNEIGEAEGIEVTDEDFESEASTIAMQLGMQTDLVSRYISEETDRRSMYESRIFRAKAMNAVMEHAKITDKEVPSDEIEEAESK